ncbi:MAG: transcription-repair coupling factor [Clostridia bacterium]|nr:transcription-repair coupling factor [Clostridia bacterium]
MNTKILTEQIKKNKGYKALMAKLLTQRENKEHFPLYANGLTLGTEYALIRSLIYDIRRTYKKTVLLCVSEERYASRLNDFLKKSGIESEFYPMRDFNFFDVTASREIEHERLKVLSGVAFNTLDVCITTPDALLQYTMPRDELISRTFSVKQSDSLDIEAFSKMLMKTGYSPSELVESEGQFALRGGIVDVFPTGSAEFKVNGEAKNENMPIRVELFGDEIDRMGVFDPITQRMVTSIESFSITPSKEIIPSEENIKEVREIIKELYLKAQGEDAKKELEREALSIDARMSLSFFDKFINLVYPEKQCLVDYFDTSSCVLICDLLAVKEKMKKSLASLEERARSLYESFLVPSELCEYCAPENRLFELLDANQAVYLDHFSSSTDKNAGGVYDFGARSIPKTNLTLNLVVDQLAHFTKEGYSCALVCRTETEVKDSIRTLNEYDISSFGVKDESTELLAGAVCVFSDTYPEGYELASEKFILMVLSSRTEKNEARARRKKKFAKNAGEKILSYADLNVGDYVVHASYGIGKYLGIENLCAMGAYRDYVAIQYAGTDKLYLPVDQLDMVSKYIGASGDDAHVKLSKMGGVEWKKSTAKAKAAAKDMAKELIELYAKRTTIKGFACRADGIMEREFASSFEFDETDSQIEAIDDIRSDMEKPYPMDRVLCGDVGYGKTEVAFRAAMKAVANGKQVAILVPTTILAMQHFQTALARFAGTGVNIDMISRFRTPSQQAKTVRALRRGDVDIIIGTHKLLSKNIEFKDLGLLIIDEEQRFGVAQKEKIKSAVPGVDVLSLSATPIPRTLSMAMGGIRDMSVLDDSPGGRLGVTSYVLEYDEELICDAIRRELHRGGQVFYLYNNVETIYDIKSRLQKAFPSARIAVAHGQMDRDDIEEIWHSLVKGEIDILVSTTIIETGIDIPNANTLIIENADRMGLAQLHQIRGRVGRSHRRAYAFFTYRKGKLLSEVATKRLDAIRDFAEFGAGFKIAMRDLEIRGAGDILGSAQHGHMEAIGYDMYIRLLNEAVLEEKGEIIPEKTEIIITLSKDAYLPKSYIKSSSQRMDMYKKIAHIENEDDYKDIVTEMKDRYGALPKVAKTLVSVALVKAYAKLAGMKKIEQMREEVRFFPSETDLILLYKMSRVDPANIKITGVGKTPYISLKTPVGDTELSGCVDLLKIYIQKSKETE